jgi:hypothetical protein
MPATAMAPEPERIGGEGRKPGLPGTDPAATEAKRKGLLAAFGGFLLLLAVHPLTIAIVVGLIVWIISRWL